MFLFDSWNATRLEGRDLWTGELLQELGNEVVIYLLHEMKMWFAYCMELIRMLWCFGHSYGLSRMTHVSTVANTASFAMSMSRQITSAVFISLMTRERNSQNHVREGIPCEPGLTNLYLVQWTHDEEITLFLSIGIWKFANHAFTHHFGSRKNKDYDEPLTSTATIQI